MVECPDALVVVRLPALGDQPLELVGGTPLETNQPLVDRAHDHRRPVVVLRVRIEVGRRPVETDDERRAIALLAGHGRPHARRLDETR